ncbi:hypothetical protein V1478_001759 [Vespula squamosa]|uniref:Uncharacterized protein n=1 Tax=Vespula squamosa TaxID=30214 RepID=A0ABD2BZM2_VESSQ
MYFSGNNRIEFIESLVAGDWSALRNDGSYSLKPEWLVDVLVADDWLTMRNGPYVWSARKFPVV